MVGADEPDAGESEQTRSAVLRDMRQLVLEGVDESEAVDRVLKAYGLSRISLARETALRGGGLSGRLPW